MNAAERQRLVAEIEQAGGCSNPIRLSGEMVNLSTGEVVASQLKVACKDRRAVVCPSCSSLYKADAWILVDAGLSGGKGVPDAVRSHPRLFLTLTAPSFGVVHTRTASGTCVTRADSPLCPHGLARTCRRQHTAVDPELGRPLCPECFDYRGAVLWNAHVSPLWSLTMQQIRREVAATIGVSQRRFPSVAQIHYLKVVEMQRRGLAHLHVLLRADGPGDIVNDPPEVLSVHRFLVAVRRVVPSVALISALGTSVRWGEVFEVHDVTDFAQDVSRVSNYLAKYATKTTDGSMELARRFQSRRQIENLVDDHHVRRLSLTAWDLSQMGDLEHFHLDAYAHAFGFTGQLITKSRGYSTTFSNLRAARADHMRPRNTHDVLEGTFSYAGRGYDDPRGTEAAEMFFRMVAQLRQEAAQARRAAHGNSPEVQRPPVSGPEPESGEGLITSDPNICDFTRERN